MLQQGCVSAVLDDRSTPVLAQVSLDSRCFSAIERITPFYVDCSGSFSPTQRMHTRSQCGKQIEGQKFMLTS